MPRPYLVCRLLLAKKRVPLRPRGTGTYLSLAWMGVRHRERTDHLRSGGAGENLRSADREGRDRADAPAHSTAITNDGAHLASPSPKASVRFLDVRRWAVPSCAIVGCNAPFATTCQPREALDAPVG